MMVSNSRCTCCGAMPMRRAISALVIPAARIARSRYSSTLAATSGTSGRPLAGEGGGTSQPSARQLATILSNRSAA
jgi:hypothetical protein